MAGVTPKTVTIWHVEGSTSAPAPLRAWAPRTDVNPSGRWSIDAESADLALGDSAAGSIQSAGHLNVERERLAVECQGVVYDRRIVIGFAGCR